MLVLDRKDDDKIEVTLIKDQKGRYKLGFDAPPEYTIYRKELEQ